jgi:hypothetical protein
MESLVAVPCLLREAASAEAARPGEGVSQLAAHEAVVSAAAAQYGPADCLVEEPGQSEHYSLPRRV